MNWRIAGTVLISGALTACGGGSSTPDAGLQPTFSSIQSQIFTGVGCNAAACHSTANPTGPSGDLDLLPDASYAALLGASGTGATIPDHTDPGELAATDAGFVLVSPGDPSKSFLYVKVAPGLNVKYGAQMPNGGLPPLSAAQVQAIGDWITAGAKND